MNMKLSRHKSYLTYFLYPQTQLPEGCFHSFHYSCSWGSFRLHQTQSLPSYFRCLHHVLPFCASSSSGELRSCPGRSSQGIAAGGPPSPSWPSHSTWPARTGPRHATTGKKQERIIHPKLSGSTPIFCGLQFPSHVASLHKNN